jgi:dihydropteroate synthase
MRSFSWRIKGKDIKFECPQVVGILNLTPDSFYASSRSATPEEALSRAKKMIDDGADMLDIGAESTRPGSALVDEAEEGRRLFPALEMIRKALPDVLVSIDTRRANIAEKALELGADVINDVSALSDPAMARVAAKFGAGFILMHSPRDLASGQNAEISTAEVRAFLDEKTAELVKAGLPVDCVVWDPGLGFGKTTDANWRLANEIDKLNAPGGRIMFGASRKRFTRPDPALPESESNSGLQGTIRANRVAVEKGAFLLRVHDVREARDLLTEGEAYAS